MYYPVFALPQRQQHPIYYGQRLRRDGEGPLDPIEWVRRDQKIRTGCTPRGELNINRNGNHAPMVQKRCGRPTPVSGSQCHDARDYRKSRQHLNNHLTPIAASTTTSTTTLLNTYPSLDLVPFACSIEDQQSHYR